MTRIFRCDNRIDEAARGGILRIEFTVVGFAYLVHLSLEGFIRRLASLLQLIKLTSEYSLHCRVAFHNSHSARRPSVDEIRIEALSSHGVVTSARSMVCRQDYFRNN